MKISKTSFFTLVFSLIFLSSAFSQAALRRANKQYELSTFSQAIKSYQEVLAKDPDNLEANSKIADCYRHLNQQSKALPHYQAAAAQAGVEPIYVFQYGLTLQELGRYDIARQVFTRLADTAPDFRTRARQFAEACSFALTSGETPLYKVSNEFVNTAFSDFGVAFFKDQVAYASGRTDIRNRDSRNAPSSSGGSNRLFITQRDKNGFLEVPVTLHAGFSNTSNEGPIAYSPDGTLVAITKNNFTDGNRLIPSSGMELTLHLAQVNEQGDWTSTTPFQHNTSGASTGFPSFSPDGKALFFASDRIGGFGGFDLYVSYKVGNNWSAPENLGSTVNSIGNEITPFYDGNSLFFASDYHKGYGGFDIFRAEESNGRWATLFHGGPGLNSSVDDYGFIFDAIRNLGYFVSNRPGGKGNEDIYRIRKEMESIVIKVTDAINGNGIEGATLDFSDCGEKNFQTNANGIFNFQLLDNLDCNATVSKSGFLSKSVKISSLGLRGSRSLEVNLVSIQNAYKGRTLNGSTGNALDNARVIATNQATQEVVVATTDVRGDYTIALLPNTTYVLRYSKAGYRDLSFNLKTGKSDSKTLQDIELLPVGVAATQATAGTITSKQPILPSTSDKNVPASYSQVKGFAVQLTASSAASIDLAPYQARVGSAGMVYSVREGKMTKIRVGIFATREAADAAQQKLKAVGYSGTFIVEDSQEVPVQQAAYTSPPQQQVKEAQPKAAAPAQQQELTGYMIRLATLRDTKNLKREQLDDLGTLSFLPKGNLTIVLLTGYDSKASANIALRKVRARGFQEAFLVTLQQDELKRAE